MLVERDCGGVLRGSLVFQNGYNLCVKTTTFRKYPTSTYFQILKTDPEYSISLLKPNSYMQTNIA